MDQLTSPQPRIADYIRPLASRKWLILLAVVIATAGIYGYYARQANVYTAGTLVYVRDPGDPVTGQPDQQATDRQVIDQASLLDSRSTAALVARAIGYKGSASDLLRRVTISSRQGSDFVQVTAQGRSAQEAAAIANGFGGEFVSLVNGAQAARIRTALTLSQQQLSALGTGRTADVGRADLTSQIDRLKLAQKDPLTISRLVQPALAPDAPSAPTPVRNALFALVVSLFLAIAAAYGLERFDRRLKNPEEMEAAYGTPLLAVLPHSSRPADVRNGAALLSVEFHEPFRVLRTNVELATLDVPAQTIVVTSAMPGEGKSTVVRNLALAMRESGQRVAVVALDLRRPSLTKMFGVSDGPGVTDVLRREAELSAASTELDVGPPGIEEMLRRVGKTPSNRSTNGANGHGEPPRPSSGVTLIRGGETPANPPAVLASERLADLLDELRKRYDVVLIDSAPLLAVTDTVPLLRYADATLLVGRLGVTTRDTAKRVMEFVARVPDLNLLGVVANDLSRVDAESYGYGYGYGIYAEAPGRTTRSAAAERVEQHAS